MKEETKEGDSSEPLGEAQTQDENRYEVCLEEAWGQQDNGWMGGLASVGQKGTGLGLVALQETKAELQVTAGGSSESSLCPEERRRCNALEPADMQACEISESVLPVRPGEGSGAAVWPPQALVTPPPSPPSPLTLPGSLPRTQERSGERRPAATRVCSKEPEWSHGSEER